MKKKLPLAVVALTLIAVLGAVTPYLLPTRIALGPCGRDWTSPRGRTVFGELVPWGELWRAGARHVEQLTFRWEPIDDRHGSLVLEWETSRVAIPLAPL